ncbi:hypothetical protein DSO57_1024801 [Entomophthora muscae]|uniref:Uncharacterized protein n=1 Tax=Entomophthora muscae TaxID=34485 RepID=A0ACC2U0U7_9FUNG|nr:hypothetical protein DSO57_1024801 [Entomophthora muscae]
MCTHLQNITQTHIKALYAEILPTNLQRRKLSVHIVSPASAPVPTTKSRPPATRNYIDDLEAWKSQQSLAT